MEANVTDPKLIRDLKIYLNVPANCQYPSFRIIVKENVEDVSTGTWGVDYHSSSNIVGGEETITGTCPLARDQKCHYPSNGCSLEGTGTFKVPN